MNIEHGHTSIGEPLIYWEAMPGRGFKFESQTDGFGMLWPTNLNVVEAVRRTRQILAEPEPADIAEVAINEESRHEVPWTGLDAVLQRQQDEVRFVSLDNGTSNLVWARSLGSGIRVTTSIGSQESTVAKPNANPFRPVMSFGDDYYFKDLVKDLLEATALIPDGESLDELLECVDDIMEPHVLPTE